MPGQCYRLGISWEGLIMMRWVSFFGVVALTLMIAVLLPLVYYFWRQKGLGWRTECYYRWRRPSLYCKDYMDAKCRGEHCCRVWRSRFPNE